MSRSSFAARGPVARLGLEILEDRRTPAAMGGASELITAVAGDTGSSPIGALYNPTGEVRVFLPVYEGTFTGGVRVATADFTGDGEADLVAGPGPGRVTQVRVINGLTGVDVFTFTAFEETFTGGVFVATGDFNGDGVADIVVSPDVTGGPRVRVLSGTDPANVVLADFFGIEDVNFRGGARVGVGDVNGDGVPDLLVGAGFGGGPRVAIFDGATLLDPLAPGELPPKLVPDFFAFEPELRNGVFLAAGDLDGDGAGDPVFGAGPGGGPRVIAVNGRRLLSSGGQTLELLANFFAGSVESRNGVRVAVKDYEADGRLDLVIGPGPGDGTAALVFRNADVLAGPEPPVADELPISDPGRRGSGVFVG